MTQIIGWVFLVGTVLLWGLVQMTGTPFSFDQTISFAALTITGAILAK